jgi:FMN phosphatase YigB (HAD superfamily)
VPLEMLAAPPRFSISRRPGLTPQIRAVLFDVDGTLYHQQPVRACMALELALAPLSLGSARAAQLARVLHAYRRAQEHLRELTPNGESIASLQVSLAASRAGVKEADVVRAIGEWMADRPVRYLRWCRRLGLIELLEKLRTRGIRLGVLSDYPCAKKLDALETTPFFSLVLCTTDSDINALKPNPRGFWRACDSWNLTPEEVLYVGDRPEVDARGAHAAGIRCAIVGSRNHATGAPEHLVARRLLDIAGLIGLD